MIKQNVNIVNFSTLYVILEEIKENLHFNIIKYESDKDFYKIEKNILKDSLIITNSSNKTISDKNLLIFNNLPISLNKLVELININLIKLRFNSQSKINIKDYELNLNSKFLIKEIKIHRKKIINFLVYFKEFNVINLSLQQNFPNKIF